MMIRILSHASLIVVTLLASVWAFADDAAAAPAKKWFPGHYARAGMNGVDNWNVEPVRDVPEFRGYIVDFTWSSIEKRENVFDFSSVRKAIADSVRDGKKLAIRFTDVSHNNCGSPHMPNYMLTEGYRGGYYCVEEKNDQGGITRKSYPKSWLPAVRSRWANYIKAFGAEFDSNETIAAVAFVESSRSPPQGNEPGYSMEQHLEWFREQNQAAAEGWPTTPVIQYLNFIPKANREQKDGLADHIVQVDKSGLGAPDIMNHSRGQTLLESNGFRASFRKYRNVVPLFVEAQRGGFLGSNARETFEYGVDEVGLNFFGWITGQRTKPNGVGFTIYDVIAVLKAEKGRINAQLPSSFASSSAKLDTPAKVSVE